MSEPEHHVLDVWPDLRPVELLRSIAGVVVKPAGSSTSTTSLHDAPDLRLTRCGAQLLRSASPDGDLWDLTAGPSPYWHRDLGDGPVRWIEPAGDGAPEAVTGLLRTATLGEVLVERTASRSWTVARPAVADAGADPPQDEPAPAEPESVLVTLHDLTVLRSRRVATRRSQLVVTGDARLAGAVVSVLQIHGAEPAEGGVPVHDVLGLRAGRPIVADRLGDDHSLQSVVRVAIGRSVARLLANDLAVRLDLGPEAVHQARVATRRLRSDLRMLRPVLEERWVNVIERELRWLAELLGDVRDVEVLTDRVHRGIGALPEPDRAVAERIAAVLTSDGDVASDALHRAMSSHRYTRLLDGLVEAAEAPKVIVDEADATPVLRRLAAEPWRSLRKKAKSLARDSIGADAAGLAELHEMRIRTKRARYAFEVVGLLVPAAAKHARRLTDLQDVLGGVHDAWVAEAWLRGRTTLHGLEGAFVLGALCAHERTEMIRCAQGWEHAWDRASGRTLAAWLDD